MEHANSPFFTVAQVAAMLGVSRVRTYQLIEQGRIPYVRLSTGRIRIPRAAWDAWLADETATALAAAGLPREEVTPNVAPHTRGSRTTTKLEP